MGVDREEVERRLHNAGFDPAAADGYGLRGMRARAEQVAGTLTVRSAPGLGTTLTLELPA